MSKTFDKIHHTIKKKGGKTMGSLIKEENGLGTVEVVLILAVLVGIALIFRQYIFTFVNDIMANIMGSSVTEIVSNPLNSH